MDKDQALEEFFKNLKKTFNITCLFSKDHPSFLKAIEDFKTNVDATFVFLKPLRIGVTPDSFLVQTKYFSGLSYRDLAKMLHLRRVKSIEIKAGVTVEELVILFYRLSMHPKEIMASGGLADILDREKISHISVEELDYSQLLKGSGSEYKDVWIYLLQEAVDRDDSAKADALADIFDKIVGHFRLREILENEKLKENLHRFISYLKDKGRDKFLQCAKDMASLILKEKEIIPEADIEKIRVFFKDLSEEDFADILSRDILNDEEFDPLSFDLFSKILDEEKHKSIALQTAKALKDKPLKDNPTLVRNVQKLLSVPETSVVSRIYRNAISSFLTDIAFANIINLDAELISGSYHSVLLNLLYEEKDREKLASILEKMTAELDKIFRKKELGYLRSLLELINKKMLADPSLGEMFEGLENLIYKLVEDAVCQQDKPGDFQYFIDNIPRSALGLDAYLTRIFNENKLNSGCLRLFLKLFPDQLPLFYQNLEEKGQDMEFLIRIAGSLSEIPGPASLEILKHMYSFSNNFIKIEVLGAMQKLPQYDSGFLLSVLKNEDFPFKKEALRILRKEQESRKKALEALFPIRNPWWTKNNMVLQNILVVEEVGLKEAKDYLVKISKRHFFWNRNIRKEALRVLKKWAF